MARKAPKKYEKMAWHEKQQFNDDMMKKYGIDRIKTQQNEITGRGGYDSEAEGQAIARAMANDYDTRRTIELAQETGNKKAAKLGQGIDSISEAVDAERFMSKTHYNRMDSGGSYDGAEDEHNVMNFWKDKAFKQRNSALNDQFGQKEIETPESTVDTTPRELSDRAKTAMDSAGDYSFKPVDRGLGNENVAYDPNAGIKDQKSGEFLNNYKQDIQSGVKKAGVSGRGMMSIHNRF